MYLVMQFLSVSFFNSCFCGFHILLVEFYSKDFISDENLNLAQPDSDSENEDVDFGNCSTLQLSEFMGFKVEPEVANLVLQLRQKWNCLFLRRMRTPSKPWSQIDEVNGAFSKTFSSVVPINKKYSILSI